MTLNYSTPVVNPRLGSGFAIFASTYTCLVLLLIVLEQLGLSAQTIDQLIVTMPALFYIAIGFMTRTTGADDFFLAGQRVPPFYNALALCATVFGGSILARQHRRVLFRWHRRDCHPARLFCRADPDRGAVRSPSQEGRRQYLAGVPAPALWQHPREAGGRAAHDRARRYRLVAEVALGGKILGYLLPLPQMLGIGLPPAAFYAALVCAGLFLTVALGGMRSATWTQGAQFVVMLSILAPLISVSVMRTNLPLPQLTYGAELEELKTLEAVRGLVAISQPQP